MAGYERYRAAQVIQAIRDTKGLVSMAAERLRCEPDTVRAYAKRHPTVAAALKEERERMTDVAELSLYNQLLKGEGWAVCFYLKTQGKDRGYVERHELTGKDGGPVELAAVTLAQRLQRIVDAEMPVLPEMSTNGTNIVDSVPLKGENAKRR